MNKPYLSQLITLGLGVVILSATSCATMFGKSSYPISVNTDPAGAEIVITNKKGTEVYRGTTPSTVKLKSSSGYFAKAEYQIKLHKNGFSDKIISVTSSLNGWYFGNIFLGGLVGMLIIDPASGAMYKITDSTFTEKLQSTTVSSSESSLNIVDYSSLSDTEKSRLLKIN